MLSRGKMDVSSFSMDTVSYVLVTIIILTVLIFCYVIGTLIVVLRYYNYTITQRDNELKITYGLLNVKISQCLLNDYKQW